MLGRCSAIVLIGLAPTKSGHLATFGIPFIRDGTHIIELTPLWVLPTRTWMNP